VEDFMKPLLSVLLVLGGLCACTPPDPIVPDAEGPERKACSLTIYNSGRALVKDTRGFELDQGLNQVRFDEVTGGIIPASVHVVQADGGDGVTVHEQNFEYDLVSTQALLQRHLGEEVRVTTASGEAHAGTLLAGGGDVILRTGTGGVVVLRADQILDVEFPDLPEGLASKPALMWSLEADRAGDHDLQVTYLSTGFGWQADYIVQLSDADDAVDVSGWVSVDNHSETGFRDAGLKLVAGDVYMQPITTVTGQTELYDAFDEVASAGYGLGGGAYKPQERSFFDYHLYEMPRPVTLRAHETKQVEFLDVAAVPAEVTYDLHFTDSWYGTTVTRHPQVTVEFVNGEEQKMGVPLPAGTVRVYKEDIDGASEFVGESRLEHTPRDETIELTVGEAFDLVGEWKQTKHRVIGDWSDEYTYEVVVRNHKTEEAKVTLKQTAYFWGEWKVTKSSAENTRPDNNTIEFEVIAPPDGEVTVTYSIRTRW
jgi:hypothetical protein